MVNYKKFDGNIFRGYYQGYGISQGYDKEVIYLYVQDFYKSGESIRELTKDSVD